MPVTVTGPDNKPYEFPDGTTKDTAVAYFKKKGVGGAPAAAPPPEPPGFLKRYGQAIGVPASKEELESMKPSTAESTAEMILGPTVTAGKMALNYGKQLLKGGKEAIQEYQSAPPGKKFEKGADAASRFVLRDLLAPVGGGAINSFAEDVGAGNVSGAAGDALGAATNLLLLGKSMPLPEEAAVNKLTYAAGGGVNASKGVEGTVNLLRETAKTIPNSNSVGGYLDTVKKAKDNINSEFGNAIGPHANQQFFPIDANGKSIIAERIRALKSKFSGISADSKQAQKMIERAALDYDRPHTLGQLDTERTRLNTELSSINGKTPSARYTAVNGSVNNMIDTALQDALRDTVYPKADALAGKPPGYFENLKRQQMNLIRLRGELEGQIDKLTARTRNEAGTHPADRVSSGAGMTASGYGYGRISGLGKALHPSNYLAKADAAAARGLSSGSKVAKAGVYSLPLRYLTELPQDDDDKKGVAKALQPIGSQ